MAQSVRVCAAASFWHHELPEFRTPISRLLLTEWLAASSMAGFHSLIAQLVERRTVNPQVPGSSPGRGARYTKGCSDAALFYLLREFVIRAVIVPLWTYLKRII